MSTLIHQMELIYVSKSVTDSDRLKIAKQMLFWRTLPKKFVDGITSVI